MSPEDPQITRPFYPMIKRCDDILAKFTFFETLMKEYRVKNTVCTDHKAFLEHFPTYSHEQDTQDDRWFEVIE
jgi:hypothetical protein